MTLDFKRYMTLNPCEVMNGIYRKWYNFAWELPKEGLDLEKRLEGLPKY